MAILKIARMGNPVLLRKCDPVPDPGAPEIRRLVADMMQTMEDAPGVGLAAPQIYVPLRLFVFRVPGERAGSDRKLHAGQKLAASLLDFLAGKRTDEGMGKDWDRAFGDPGKQRMTG